MNRFRGILALTSSACYFFYRAALEGGRDNLGSNKITTTTPVAQDARAMQMLRRSRQVSDSKAAAALDLAKKLQRRVVRNHDESISEDNRRRRSQGESGGNHDKVDRLVDQVEKCQLLDNPLLPQSPGASSQSLSQQEKGIEDQLEKRRKRQEAALALLTEAADLSLAGDVAGAERALAKKKALDAQVNSEGESYPLRS